jgi:hypothetical protein
VIQTEGLPIWDGTKKTLFKSNPFLFVATADGPGAAFLTGLLGHHGRFACHLYCGLPGRHKPGTPTYYPALHQPEGTDHLDHPNFFIDRLPLPGSFDYERNLKHVICCSTMAEYKLARLEIGITNLASSAALTLTIFCWSCSVLAPTSCTLLPSIPAISFYPSGEEL